MTMLLNRSDGRPDELALIRSEPISMQWTNELRRNIGLHPSCKLLRELLSLDLSTRTVVYPLLFKGWSLGRIADRFKDFPYHNSKAIGNRSRAIEEKVGSAQLESKLRMKGSSKTQRDDL